MIKGSSPAVYWKDVSDKTNNIIEKKIKVDYLGRHQKKNYITIDPIT